MELKFLISEFFEDSNRSFFRSSEEVSYAVNFGKQKLFDLVYASMDRDGEL